MKKTIVNSLNILIIAFFLSISASGIAQPPPPPGGSNTQGNKQGAPIGGGLFILLGLAAAYGGRKIYNLRKEHLED